MYQCHINHLLFYNISLITYQKKKKKNHLLFYDGEGNRVGGKYKVP